MKFTYENVLAALEAAVAAKGEDYVYTKQNDSCTYTAFDKAPSCIVGHVVAKIDPPTLEKLFDLEYGPMSEFLSEYPDLDQSEFAPDSQPFTVVVGDYYTDEDSGLVEPNSGMENALSRALTAAQASQDSGDTWGRALERFKETYAREIATEVAL